jgi:hypothetical protein
MRIDRGPLLSSGPAQEGALLLAEPDDGDEAFRAGQNRDQAEKQDFLKRIDHLAKLPAIRRVLEIREKNSRLGACSNRSVRVCSIALICSRSMAIRAMPRRMSSSVFCKIGMSSGVRNASGFLA